MGSLYSKGYAEEQWDLVETLQAVFLVPSYHIVFELGLIVCIVVLLLKKTSGPKRLKLSEKEKQELIRDWRPEPLVDDREIDDPGACGDAGSSNGETGTSTTGRRSVESFNRVVEGMIGRLIVIGGRRLLNMASLNFLSMIGRSAIEEQAVKTLRKYGVGSCGPRGFYGTIDVHLDLETRLSRFTGTEEVIVYSYSFATIASAIPAYAKRTDIIYCDEGVNFSIQKGVDASRSKVHYFRHNDMIHLQQLLNTQFVEDKKDKNKARATRKFLIVEGVYQNYGDLCPLPRLVELKNQYKLRLFIDESISFGTMGATGRGITEHYAIDIDEVDMITASLENAFAAVGGFACGKSYIIDHQRLSGQGYCFSASTPPMLSTATIVALDILDSDFGILHKLQKNAHYLYEKLSQLDNICLRGDHGSPILHVRENKTFTNRESEVESLLNIIKEFDSSSIAIVQSAYLTSEKKMPEPSIRLALSSDLTTEDLDQVVEAFKQIH